MTIEIATKLRPIGPGSSRILDCLTKKRASLERNTVDLSRSPRVIQNKLMC